MNAADRVRAGLAWGFVFGCVSHFGWLWLNGSLLYHGPAPEWAVWFWFGVCAIDIVVFWLMLAQPRAGSRIAGFPALAVISPSIMSRRRLLVTSALPYANGAIHLGHLVEYIQTDIWVRFQRMRGHAVHYVCADDTHGTPVMLRAEKEGLTPEQLINRVHGEHLRDFTAFGVAFDNYHSTHSTENRFYAEDIYGKLQAGGMIDTRSIEQYYDPVKEMFLPDRFIKGECPKCGAADQYGDNCEACGAAYAPTELKNPYSAVSGAKPVLKTSEHYFFRLSDERAVAFLREWTRGTNAAGERRLQPGATLGALGRREADGGHSEVRFDLAPEGERVLLLDDGEYIMNPGDVVVQIGNWHGWCNPNEGSLMAFVMMGAKYEG